MLYILGINYLIFRCETYSNTPLPRSSMDIAWGSTLRHGHLKRKILWE